MDNLRIFFAIGSQDKLETAIKTLEDGVQNKHIWNVDYVAAKDVLTRQFENIEDVMYAPVRNAYYPCGGSEVYKTWSDKDPRFNLPLYQLNYAPGYVKKLKAIKDAPELKVYISFLEEASKLAELIKAAQPYIVKGRKPSENPVEKDYSNTGICPVCLKRHKLEFNGTLVAHGYTLPRNWGGRNGMCIGRGHKAWELSPEGGVYFKSVMERQLAEEKKTLDDLQKDVLPTLMEKVRVRKGFGEYVYETRSYERGTADYNRVKQSAIYSTESTIRYLTSDIKAVSDRIENWKEQPLQYGGAETQERWKSKLLNK